MIRRSTGELRNDHTGIGISGNDMGKTSYFYVMDEWCAKNRLFQFKSHPLQRSQLFTDQITGFYTDIAYFQKTANFLQTNQKTA